MKQLKIIKDMDIPQDESSLTIRECSRGVFFDDQHLTPLLHAVNSGIHELPGGGIEKGEDKMTGLIREVMEEAGGEINVTQELGEIVEYRRELSIKQISYCYLGTIKKVAQPVYTEEEIKDGTILEWMTLDEAISKLNSDNSSEYEGSFIKERDLFLLNLAKQITKY